RHPSGLAAYDLPAVTDARPLEAVVQPAGAPLPELDGLGAQPIATPGRRHRHLPPGELLPVRRVRLLQLLARTHRLRLVRRPGADLRTAWPEPEVRLDLIGREGGGDGLDPDLAFNRVPPEEQRTGGVDGQVDPLAGGVVGEEDETALV